MTTFLSPQPTYLSTNPPRRARIATYAAFGLAGALMGSWLPRLPEMKLRLHLSAGSFGLALLATAIGALIALPIAAQLINRWGSARVTRLFAACFCAAAVLPGLATTLAQLWILLFCWGFAMGAMDVAMNAQAVSVEKAYRRPLMSGFHAAWSLGSVLGAGIGTLGIALGSSIVGQQAVSATVLGIVMLHLSPAMVGDPNRGDRHDRCADEPLGRHPSRIVGSLDPRVVLLGLAGMTAMLSEGSVGDWTPILLRDSLHAPASHVGLAYAGFMIAQTLGRLVGDRVIQAVGRERAIVWMTGIGVGGLVAGMATDTVIGTIAGFTALGIGLAITVPVAFSAAADGRANAGPALAAVSSLSYTGFLAGPTAIGLIAELTSVRVALWLVPFIVAGGAALAVSALRRTALRRTAVRRPTAGPPTTSGRQTTAVPVSVR